MAPEPRIVERGTCEEGHQWYAADEQVPGQIQMWRIPKNEAEPAFATGYLQSNEDESECSVWVQQGDEELVPCTMRGPNAFDRASTHLTVAYESFVDDYRKHLSGL